jgi:lysophospholipase L1-like esterase
MALPKTIYISLAFFFGVAIILGLIRLVHILSATSKLNATAIDFAQDYYVGNPSNPAFLYVVLGDSTAAGVGAPSVNQTYPYLIADHIANQGKYVHVLSYAVSGARLENVEKEQLPKLHVENPDLVTLTIGANDATHRTELEDYTKSLTAVVSGLQQKKPHTVIWANTPDMSLTPALPPFFANRAQQRAIQQNKILSPVLIQAKFSEVNLYEKVRLSRTDLTQYASDEFHPSVGGYAHWAQAFIDLLPPQH